MSPKSNAVSLSLLLLHCAVALARTCDDDDGSTSSSGSYVVGFIGVFVAILLFGTNYVPVKRYDPGDGLFFQWVLCSGVFIVGFILYAIRGFPEFYPYSIVGGVLWATGNMFAPAVIKSIGLGLGLVVWGMGNLVVGWSVGNFGLFGVDAECVPVPWLNYVGFALACFSLVIYGCVKPVDNEDKFEEESLLLHDAKNINTIEDDVFNVSEPLFSDDSAVGRFWNQHNRACGFGLALFMGLLFGVYFAPATHSIDKASDLDEHSVGDHHSIHSLDYVFPEFCGIYLTSTFYFLIYCAYKQNKPVVNRELFLPGILSGVMWGVAQSSFQLANSQLSIVIAYPMIAIGPGLVGSLVGVLYFKEIKGRKNLLFLGGAFACTILAVILITLSKVV